MVVLNLKEADDIIEACEKNKVKLAVISQLRFAEAVCKNRINAFMSTDLSLIATQSNLSYWNR